MMKMVMEKSNGKSILYTASAVAGLLAVFVFRRNLAAEISLFGYFGAVPSGVTIDQMTMGEVLMLFHQIPIIAFLVFNFFDIINVALVAVLMTPVYILIKGKKSRRVYFAALMSILCVVFYVLSNNAILYYLKAAAYALGDESDKRKILAAIETRSGEYFFSNLGLLMLYGSGFLTSLLLQTKRIFSKYSVAFGVVSNGIGLLYFPMYLFSPEYNYLCIVLAAPFTVVWYANLSLNLLKLNRNFKAE